jgi:hypothetical protein
VRRAAWGLAGVVSLVCALVIARTVLAWRADALRWRGAGAAVALDTLAVQAALAARDSAVARERLTGARLDSVLRRWEETRGAVPPRGRSGPATVAPPTVAAVVAACDELADACAAFRADAAARAVADSAALAAERVAAQRLLAVERRAVDSVWTVVRDTVRALRRPWWRPTVTVGAACVASQFVTCGPGVALGWRIR